MICMRLSRIFEILMIIMDMRSGNLEVFFSYFVLTSEQKCHYAQMKLIGKAYYWGKGSHIDYRYWFVLKDFRTLYASHILYSFEADYKELEVVDESELEVVDKPEPEAVDKVDPKHPVLVEPDIVDEPDSEVVDEAELESGVKEPLMKTLVDLPVESIMESSLTAISLRSPDVYDPLQIFL